ncbi:MAG: hypothetical protein V8Q71_00235, partial [Bacilli bacterium]
MSQRIHDENTREDITTKEMVCEWLNKNTEFLSKSLRAINNTLDINDLNNTKMILGLIDNIRNYLLILLNQQIVNNKIEKNIMVNFETLAKDSLMYELYNSLISTEKLMKNISLNENYKINSIDIEKLIKNT